jgi:hypothetical protein
MDEIIRRIKHSLNAYEEMQRLHLDGIGTRPSSKLLTKFNFERSSNFERLKNELTLLLKKSNNGNDDIWLNVAGECRKRLGTIMETDKKIAEKIRTYRDELRIDMNRIGHGKRAIKGYGNALSSSSPLFMSHSE